jgi:hypothetical protein
VVVLERCVVSWRVRTGAPQGDFLKADPRAGRPKGPRSDRLCSAALRRMWSGNWIANDPPNPQRARIINAIRAVVIAPLMVDRRYIMAR